MAGSSASGCGCGRCRAQSGVAPAWESPSSRAVLEERSDKQRTSPSGSDRGGARVYDGALGVQSTAIPPGASTRANAVRRAIATSLPTSIYSSTLLDRYCVSARPPLSISIEVVTITDSIPRAEPTHVTVICPGRKPPFLAVKHPARPYKSTIERRVTVGNGGGT